MTRFFVRRVLQGLVVVVGIMVVVFVVTRFVGDPVRVMLPVDATEQERIDLRASLGLDDSVPLQLARYAGEVVRGDFGDSLWQRRPALDIVMDSFPNTIK